MNNIVRMDRPSLPKVGTVPQLTCDRLWAGGTPFGEEFAKALGAIRLVLPACESLAGQRPGFIFVLIWLYLGFAYLVQLVQVKHSLCQGSFLYVTPPAVITWGWTTFSNHPELEHFHFSYSPYCTWYIWWRICPRSSQRSRCRAPEMKNNQDTGLDSKLS